MKNTYPFLVLLSLLIFTACSTPKKSKRFKVMTWNIWHGGTHGDAASDFKKDTANTVNILKVLQQEQSDVLFMQETYCCGMDIAKKAGYPHSWRGSSNLSIHSKYPIIDTISLFKPFNSHGVVLDVHGQKILAVNIWLHYLPDYFQNIKTSSSADLVAGESATRLPEITAIVKAVDSLQQAMNIPVILGGDFNSGSHLDWVEGTKLSHYDKVVEWPVSTLMGLNGYTDSFRQMHPDPTKTMEGTWGFLNDAIISDRIDFIYYKGGRIKARNSNIVMDNPNGGFFNSDHRGILTEFEIVE